MIRNEQPKRKKADKKLRLSVYHATNSTKQNKSDNPTDNY